jgi:hypothetical protein
VSVFIVSKLLPKFPDVVTIGDLWKCCVKVRQCSLVVGSSDIPANILDSDRHMYVQGVWSFKPNTDGVLVVVL